MPSPRPPLARLAAIVALALLAARVVGAQEAYVPLAPQMLPLPGSESENLLRLRQLLGLESSEGYLLRSVGTRIAGDTSAQGRVRLFAPEVFVGRNGGHAWGFNDGPLRAGRGANILASAGLAVERGRWILVLVPQFVFEENLAFQTIPWPQSNPPSRNVWANPFYPLPTSLDYPQRFGDAPRSDVRVQGRLAVMLHDAVRVGVGTENRWWGPGARNALLLSANAPGFAQAFVESPSPIRTRVGAFEYTLVLGRLQESEYFDFDEDNDARSLSAAALTWRPGSGEQPWPTIGFSRAVMARRAPGLSTLFDFARSVGRPFTRTADSLKHRDQITSVFARWLFPAQGAEAYAEWARFEEPANLRDLLEHPGHTLGYLVGAQWARPWREGVLHFQAEFSYVEPSPSVRVRPIGTSYTSPSVPQGWTNEGQMLGPSIGPAGSSQHFLVDYHTPRWRTGLTLGRWRRDANYRHVNPLPFKREDVSLWVGLRAGRAFGPVDALLEVSDGVRLNHLYQAYELPEPGQTEGVDLLNRTISVTLTPRLPRSTP